MLDLDIGTILWEIVNFLVLTVILYFLVFKPMTKRAETRAVEKAATRAALLADRDAAAAKAAELDERLLNLDQEIEQITDQAYENSQILQRDLLEATREEANLIMMEAVSEARKEQEVDIKRSQAELVDTVIRISNDTLLQVTPPGVHEGLLEELNSTIWNMGKTDMRMVQGIRDSLVDRIPTVGIVVPRELTNEQLMRLLNSLNALADKEVDLEIDIQPELVAGIKVRIGDIVLDNSVGTHLNSLKDDISRKLETLAAPDND
ncbi:MAG: F0F1 ATP synthase subunit delta [Anaerolineaceae bacterium]|jgi:F0F1-type ATP synthase membrane subunit b/b'